MFGGGSDAPTLPSAFDSGGLGSYPHTTMKLISLTFAAVCALIFASIASGAVTIYANDVNGQQAFESLKQFDGKECSKSWRKKQSLGFTVDGGRSACSWKLPVEGDSAQPDHTLQAVAKVANGTDKKAKEDTFLGLRIRANRKQGYEMRVFPKSRQWEFRRNGKMIEEGTDRAIGAIGKKNLMRLASGGNTIVARVNNAVLVNFKETSPGQVDGRKALLTSGIAGRTKKDALGLFDQIKLILPNP